MLKVLLSLYVSLSALSLAAQTAAPDVTSPAEVVVEDPGQTITDIVPIVNEKGKVNLTWRVSDTIPEFFAIERSNDDGKNFEIVAVLSNLERRKFYQWTDEAPRNGRNLYRLRYSFKPSDSLYSKTVAASVTANVSIKFYPNPVDHILIVRSETPIDVHIIDANGKVRISRSTVNGLGTINVSSLEKGLYLIRFSNKLTAVMYQEKLVKN